MPASAKPHKSALRLVKRTLYDVRSSAYDAGLMSGRRDYTRFIILASARTGSTLLTRTLDQHGQVVTYGELMRHPDRYPPHFPELGNSEGLFRSDPARFLEERVYRTQPADIAAVGFKIFYRHAPRDTAWGKAVWDYLSGQPALRVIDLRRRNLLEAHISRKRAALAEEWIKYSGSSAAAEPLELAYDETLARFEDTRAWEAEFSALFAGHPRIEVYYEDMAGDYEAEMRRVQAFLGLSPRELPPATKKRPPQPLSEQVANYHELKARFAGTPWSEFFTE